MVLTYLELAKEQDPAHQQELVTIASTMLLISAQPLMMDHLGGRGTGAGAQFAHAVSDLVTELQQPDETSHPQLEAWGGPDVPEFPGLSGVLARNTATCAAAVLRLARSGMPSAALDSVRTTLAVGLKLAEHSAVASQTPQALLDAAVAMRPNLAAYRQMSRYAGGLNYEVLGHAELVDEHDVIDDRLVMSDPAASLRAGLVRWGQCEAMLQEVRASSDAFTLLAGVHDLVTETAAALKVLPYAAARLGQEMPAEARVAEEYRVFGTEIILGQGSPLLSDLIGFDHTGPQATYRRFPFLIGPRNYRAGRAARTTAPGAATWRDYQVVIEGYTAVAAAVDAAVGAPFVRPPGSRVRSHPSSNPASA